MEEPADFLPVSVVTQRDKYVDRRIHSGELENSEGALDGLAWCLFASVRERLDVVCRWDTYCVVRAQGECMDTKCWCVCFGRLCSVLAQPPTEDNRLRTSANKESNDAYDVTDSLTGYEPNDSVVNELVNSQGSFSYVHPSSDLDIADATLGKLLTEAHREYADYRIPEGVSVSQSSLSVVFNRTGKPVGERNVDQSIGIGVTRNTYSAHNKFTENNQAEKVVDRTVKLEERNSSNAQIRTLLEEQTDDYRSILRVITNSKQLMQKNAEFYEKMYGDSNWNFVKVINKVFQRWRNYENSKVLPSIHSQDESSSRTRSLFWNYQAEYKNCKMK